MPESTPGRGTYVQGSLIQIPLPKVLNFINQAGKTGILALSQGKRKVHIHFDRGEIVYVTSSYFPEMSLGDYLVKKGLISREIHDEAIDHARNDKIRLGAYLVEKNYLSPHDLYSVLNNQVSKKLFKLFSWSEGEFFFKEGEIIDEEHRILNISFANLLYRGVRNHFPLAKPPTEFRGRKEAVLVKRLVGRHRIEELRLGPSDIRIYNAINGERTLRQVVALADISKRATYKILYALFLLELIGFPEAKRSDRLARTQQSGRGRQPASRKDRQGYEVNISNDLIAEAMASVDRIHEQVKSEDQEEIRNAIAGYDEALDADEDVFISQVNQQVGQAEQAASMESVDEADWPPPEPRENPADDQQTDPFAVVDDPSQVDPFQNMDFDPAPSGEKTGAEDYGIEDEPDDESGESDFMMDLESYTNPEDLLKQANYMLEEDNWEAARLYLERALTLDENFSDAYALLGWTQFNENAGDQAAANEAEKTIKKGMKLDPNNFINFLYLGKIYAKLEQYEFAELHFVKALELNVECSEAKEEIKRLYSR